MNGQKTPITLACNALGYTRQAFYKSVTTVRKPQNDTHYMNQIFADVHQARRKHPTKGCRAVYEQCGHGWALGRDKSIAVLLSCGFRVKYPKRYGRATQSGTRAFANLLVNKQVSGTNQVWQADMAYYLFAPKPVYTIYITDVYSQEIVGFGAYATNEAINYAQVLERAVLGQTKLGLPVNQLIHHSDGGKQYESQVYTQVCQKQGITQSMCLYSYENPYAEKTNDLINNGYLNVWKPTSLTQIRYCQQKAVHNHNQNSRKKVLGKRSPLEFKACLTSELVHDQVKYVLYLKPSQPEQPRPRTPILITH
jgi:transposase InsO family protein